jgi:PPIC-type PPIASE domain/SurA N-terminal domain
MMKAKFKVGLLILAMVSSAWGQLLSSHAASAAALPNANAETAPPSARPVVRVNGTVLTDRDLEREEYTIFPYARQHNGVPAAMENEIRAGALKMIEFEELVYQEALHRGMTIAPERMQKAEAEFRKQFSNRQQYDEVLNREFKGSTAGLRSKIKRSLLIEDLLKREVEDKSLVSVAQARLYYDKNPQRFQYAEAFVFQSVSFLPPANATVAQAMEARKRAEKTLSDAKATKSYEEFGVLAERVSEDDFRVMMGDHQQAERSKLPTKVADALAAMQPGQVSEIIEFDTNQFTILRLKEHMAAGERTFQQVQPSLREWLRKQKSEQLRKDLDAKLRKNAKVEEL